MVDDGGEFGEVVFAGLDVFEENFALGEAGREGLDFVVEWEDFVEGERLGVGDLFELLDEEVALVDDVFEPVVQVDEFDGELVDRVEQLFEVSDLVFVLDQVREVARQLVDVVFEGLDDFFFVGEEDSTVLDVVVFLDAFAELDEGDLFVGFFFEVFGESLVLFAFGDLAVEVLDVVDVVEEFLEVDEFGAFGVDFVDGVEFAFVVEEVLADFDAEVESFDDVDDVVVVGEDFVVEEVDGDFVEVLEVVAAAEAGEVGGGKKGSDFRGAQAEGFRGKFWVVGGDRSEGRE